MIKPLQIGKKHFPNNLIQGPLAGISCAPFRRLTWEYSQPAFSCTEMISCKTLVYQAKKNHHRFVTKSPQEGPVCFQLSATDPSELALATKIASDYGADLIDLNCGCPVKKIRQKGAGSSLLANPQLLYQLISAIKNSTDIPVGVKIRIDANSDEHFDAVVAGVINDAGADFVIVHGRHWTHGYETTCNYDGIRFFVEALKIPVIGNGDIEDITSLRTMFATNCQGAMISRAGVGQPWLIGELKANMQGEIFHPPASEKIGELFLTHITELTQLLNNETLALIQGRKLAKYYARTLAHKDEFCAAVNQVENLDTLEEICSRYFLSE